ncbi:MAG: hypothetical protein HRT65_05075 [Flavobacteriaceae bacterium]|nr:hypothetical protein [Flavobacteriaceae bacterium]
MKRLTIILSLLTLSFCMAQQREIEPSLLAEIESDVWIPFMEAYADLDAAKLKSIHTEDIFRVTLDNNTVRTGIPYLERFGGFLESTKANEGGLGIAFALVSTAVNETKDLVYQTGYYEFSSKNAEEPQPLVRGFGFFTVGIRKTEMGWKLFHDVDKRVDLTREVFEAQSKVYRLARN